MKRVETQNDSSLDSKNNLHVINSPNKIVQEGENYGLNLIVRTVQGYNSKDESLNTDYADVFGLEYKHQRGSRGGSPIKRQLAQTQSCRRPSEKNSSEKNSSENSSEKKMKEMRSSRRDCR